MTYWVANNTGNAARPTGFTRLANNTFNWL
jgi:hypothetical protein